jgi:hypothetical protein
MTGGDHAAAREPKKLVILPGGHFDAYGTLTFTLSLGVEEVNPDPEGGQPPIDLQQWLVSGRGS